MHQKPRFCCSSNTSKASMGEKWRKDQGRLNKSVAYNHWCWGVQLILAWGTLPETNSSPLKIGRAPKGNSSSNHWSVGDMLVSWRVHLGQIAYYPSTTICRTNQKVSVIKNHICNRQHQTKFQEKKRVIPWINPPKLIQQPKFLTISKGF